MMKNVRGDKSVSSSIVCVFFPHQVRKWIILLNQVSYCSDLSCKSGGFVVCAFGDSVARGKKFLMAAIKLSPPHWYPIPLMNIILLLTFVFNLCLTFVSKIHWKGRLFLKSRNIFDQACACMLKGEASSLQVQYHSSIRQCEGIIEKVTIKRRCMRTIITTRALLYSPVLPLYRWMHAGLFMMVDGMLLWLDVAYRMRWIWGMFLLFYLHSIYIWMVTCGGDRMVLQHTSTRVSADVSNARSHSSRTCFSLDPRSQKPPFAAMCLIVFEACAVYSSTSLVHFPRCTVMISRVWGRSMRDGYMKQSIIGEILCYRHYFRAICDSLSFICLCSFLSCLYNNLVSRVLQVLQLPPYHLFNHLIGPCCPSPAWRVPFAILAAPPSTPSPRSLIPSPTGFPALPVNPLTVSPRPRPTAPTTPPTVFVRPEVVFWGKLIVSAIVSWTRKGKDNARLWWVPISFCQADPEERRGTTPNRSQYRWSRKRAEEARGKDNHLPLQSRSPNWHQTRHRTCCYSSRVLMTNWFLLLMIVIALNDEEWLSHDVLDFNEESVKKISVCQHVAVPYPFQWQRVRISSRLEGGPSNDVTSRHSLLV